MNGFFALVWSGFSEARRNRVTSVVFAFALVLLLSTTLVLDLTISTFRRVIVDLGLGAMSLMGVFLAIFLSCGLLAREIERRTIFLIVSKPISRNGFLLARYGGNLVTLALLLLGMTAIYVAQLLFYGVDFTQPQVLSIVGLFFELMVLSAVGFLMSSFSSPIVSALISVGIYIAGHLSGDIYNLAKRSESAAAQVLGKAVYYALPNLDRLNFRAQATYDQSVAWGEFGGAVAVALAWSALFIVVASAIFQRRDFK